jgi:hypothetical protein
MTAASLVREALRDAAMITAFVTVMMVSIEYLSVISRGALQREMGKSRWREYVVGAVLGAAPGCLGPFMVVALYTHRVVGRGALVATMIATSGDEGWVMLAMFPQQAVLLMLGLLAVGVAAGAATDALVTRSRYTGEPCADLVIHEDESCRCFPGRHTIRQWLHPMPVRSAATLGMGLYTISVAGGGIGPPTWNWIRISLVVSGLVGVFVVATVPDHFLKEHLWGHVIRRHVPAIFAWTVGALLVVSLLEQAVDLRTLVSENRWAVLASSAGVGLIPESGPHLVFATMFRDGTIPVSVLVTSSIVQDGHGMLPLLAASRREFVAVKLINLIVGLVIGSILLSLGA